MQSKRTCWGAATFMRRLALRRALASGAICSPTQAQKQQQRRRTDSHKCHSAASPTPALKHRAANCHRKQTQGPQGMPTTDTAAATRDPGAAQHPRLYGYTTEPAVAAADLWCIRVQPRSRWLPSCSTPACDLFPPSHAPPRSRHSRRAQSDRQRVRSPHSAARILRQHALARRPARTNTPPAHTVLQSLQSSLRVAR